MSFGDDFNYFNVATCPDCGREFRGEWAQVNLAKHNCPVKQGVPATGEKTE